MDKIKAICLLPTRKDLAEAALANALVQLNLLGQGGGQAQQVGGWLLLARKGPRAAGATLCMKKLLPSSGLHEGMHPHGRAFIGCVCSEQAMHDNTIPKHIG